MTGDRWFDSVNLQTSKSMPVQLTVDDNNASAHNLIVLLRLFIDHLYSVLHVTKLISQNVLRDISAPSHHCFCNRVETRSRAQIKF